MNPCVGITAKTMNHDSLNNLLRSTARLVRLHVAMRAAARGLSLIVVALLVAVAVDAMFALPVAGLVMVDVILISLALGALGYVLLQTASARFDRQRTARHIEDRLELSQSDLINAVQLADQSGDATSLALRDATIAKGHRFAATLIPSQIIDKRPAQTACGYALAALLIAGIAWFLLPSVMQTTLARYVNPFGDLPPFTLVNFQIDHPAEVYEGERADIRVTLTGSNLPEQANIVFIDTPSNNQNITASHPMLRMTETTQYLYPIEKADRTRHFYVNTSAGRSEKRTIRVLPVPRFESVMVTYEPPAYTGWKTTSEPLSQQGIRALAGTKVTLTIKSSLPLAESDMTLEYEVKPELLSSSPPAITDPSALRLRPLASDPTTASVLLDTNVSSTFHIHLIADNEQKSRSLKPLTGKIEVLRDEPPRVAIVEPMERQIIAPVGWKVPVVIEAEDDVKVQRISLFHHLNDAASTETHLPLLSRSASQVQAKHEIDLAKLNAKAGDVITFFATAYDNYPFAQTKSSKPEGASNIEGVLGQSTDTETYTIHVISMEDYQNHARSQYQMEEILAEIERFDQLLKNLDDQRAALLAEAQALEKKIADQGGVPTAEDEKQLALLNEKLAAYAEQQWKLAKEMRDRSEQPNLYDFERAYAQMLEGQANQLDRGAEDATKLKRENEFNQSEKPGDKSETTRHLKQMAQQLKRDEARIDEAQANTKAATGDMALIEKADRIMGQAQRVPSLVEAQRDLANRLAPFKDKKELTPAEQIRAQRLAMEQQALKEELSEIVKELEEAAKAAEAQLPNMAESARDIAAKIREMDIQGDQAGAQESAAQGDGTKAHALAGAAADKLESLLSQAENMEAQGQSDFADAKFKLQKQSLGQGLQQLSQGRNLPKLGEGKPGQSSSNNSSQMNMAGAKGLRGKVSVYGPRSTGQSSAQKRGGRDGTGKGTATGADASQATAAETLSPDTATQRGSGATAIPGVPSRYRDLAEQYFRRLAEESK